MGDNFFTPWDTNTNFKPDAMNAPLQELDRAIGYMKDMIVSCDGTISYNSGTGRLSWDDTIRVIFNGSNGYAYENTIAAGYVDLTDSQMAYINLAETDGQAVSVAAATITTDAASNFIAYNLFVLGYRNAASDNFYPVGIRAVWGDAADSHARQHDIDDVADHNGVGGAIEDNLMSFDANGLPQDSSIAGTDVSDAVSKKHTRLHNIDAAADHNGVGGAIENNIVSFDANGLPKDSGYSATTIGTSSHARQHDIDATADHNGVGGAIEDNLISFDANGLPKDSGIATPLTAGYGSTHNGTFAASTVVLFIPMIETTVFPASLTGSQGALQTAATAQTDFDIQKNGVSFGTMRFAAAVTTATFIAAAQSSFSAGDVLKVISPGTPDATAAGLGFLLKGSRG